MTKAKVRRILKRHLGSIAEIARRAKVARPSVSCWLHGRMTSQNIARHAEEVARELSASSRIVVHSDSAESEQS